MSIRGELKVGLAGRRGRAFLPGLSAVPEVRVVAFCDINPATLNAIAEQHRIEQRYTDFGEMAENACYSKPNVLVRSMVEAGLFGEIYYIEGAYMHDCHSIHPGAGVRGVDRSWRDTFVRA